MLRNGGEDMITRKIYLSVVSIITVLGLSLPAWSAELNDKYLLGKWAIDAIDCSASNSEFVIFRDSGAVENVRGGKLEAAGFWKLEDDIMKIDVVASPAFFHDAREDAVDLKAFEGEYLAFRIRVVPFDVKPDRFDVVGILGEEVIRDVFHRCKS
jgi:hypothetical protein